MRKTARLMLLLMLAVCLPLCACGNNTDKGSLWRSFFIWPVDKGRRKPV